MGDKQPDNQPTDDVTEPGDTVPAQTDDAALAAFVEHSKSLTVEEPEVVQERILRNLLRATTVDEILRAGEAVSASELLNVPVTVMGIRASESSYEAGNDLYLHVDAKVLGNGDTVTFSCGARDVVTKLIRMDQLGLFPVDVVLTKADKPTREGYYPVFLRPTDADGEPF